MTSPSLKLNLHETANLISRRGEHKAIAIVVGGIFDLHGTANQISKGSQKVELAKLLGIWKKIGLAHTQTFQIKV